MMSICCNRLKLSLTCAALAAALALPTGLGLAIVRQVAEAHGGTVTAEQPDGGGTLMRFRLNGRAGS